jgi:hypothetical protein
MRWRPVLLTLFLPLLPNLCVRAQADDKITLHENLHPNQTVIYSIDWDDKQKSTSTTNGIATPGDSEIHTFWKVAMTFLDVRDGSGWRASAAVDPGSYDLVQSAGAPEQKSPCPFAGRTIVITRHPDETITNDFTGSDPNGDTGLLNSCLSPDGDYYSDAPVSVGDVWDNSAKASKHAGLGPNDRFSSRCRLDSVKTVNGKRIAQISVSAATVMHESGNVEEDSQYKIVDLVDVAAGMVVQCDESGSSTYSTPASEPTQVTGGTTFIFHAEVIPNPAAAPATQP